MLELTARSWVGQLLAPVVRLLARLGVTPTGVTLSGLMVMIGGAAVIGAGHPFTGCVIAAAGAVLDLLDGPLARTTGRASARGALVDTVSDRLGEVALWTGLAYFIASDPLRVALCVTGLGASVVVPFVRAKAEAAGVEGKGGWMGRTERLILFFLGVGFSPWLPTLDATLWLLTVLAFATVAQRFYSTWAQLDG